MNSVGFILRQTPVCARYGFEATVRLGSRRCIACAEQIYIVNKLDESLIAHVNSVM